MEILRIDSILGNKVADFDRVRCSDWDPTKYHDQYQTALKELLEAKIAKRPLKAKETPRRTSGDVVDLVKILQECLAASGGKKERPKVTQGGKRSTATMVKQKRPRTAL